VELTPSYEPTPFHPSDIKEIVGLVDDLAAPKNEATQFVHDHLSVKSLELLNQSPSDQLRISLIADLNQIIIGPSLYTPLRFQSVFVSPQSRELLEQPSLNKTDGSIVLNRSLIQDVFQNSLSKKFNYRLPFEAAVLVAFIALIAALISRPGPFAKPQ
jgi:hypothetical protein